MKVEVMDVRVVTKRVRTIEEIAFGLPDDLVCAHLDGCSLGEMVFDHALSHQSEGWTWTRMSLSQVEMVYGQVRSCPCWKEEQ
jgi:hypothetical protein